MNTPPLAKLNPLSLHDALPILAMSGAVGLWGLRAYPISHDDVFLGLIGERAPRVLSVLTYGYATLWFTTPYFAAALRSEEHTSELQSHVILVCRLLLEKANTAD